MQIEKPDIILAHLVEDAGENETGEKPIMVSSESTVKVSTLDEMVESIMNPSAKEVKSLIDKVSQMATNLTDTILSESESSVAKEDEPLAQPIPLNPENDKRFIQQVINFLAGSEFEQQCQTVGAKYKLPPKVVAKNFCLRILGTIGDVLGIAINVTRNFVKGTIQLLISILFGGVDLICNVAQGLVSVITLNQTAQSPTKS